MLIKKRVWVLRHIVSMLVKNAAWHDQPYVFWKKFFWQIMFLTFRNIMYYGKCVEHFGLSITSVLFVIAETRKYNEIWFFFHEKLGVDSDGFLRGIPKFLCRKYNKCFLLHKKFVAKCILICDPKTLIFSQVLSTFASSLYVLVQYVCSVVSAVWCNFLLIQFISVQ